MKKIIIIIVATILLAIIAFNIGKILGRKVFEGEEQHITKTEEENVTKENNEEKVISDGTGDLSSGTENDE